MKYVSGKNYFNEGSFNEMCEVLEQGEEITVSIDCIGHTRNNMEQEAYKKELVKKYGEQLEVKYNDGYCSYSYSYKLK